MTVPVLQLRNVEKRYGRRGALALRGVSLRVERGECYGLAGPNGAGKTTLIRILLGQITPSAGEARILGQPPDDPEVRHAVGFVPEAAELPGSASPRALVCRFARLRGLPLRAAQARGIALLQRMGMGEILARCSASPRASGSGRCSRSPCWRSRHCSCWTNRPTVSTRSVAVSSGK